MQFAVPQFTEVEDKLIGSLTLKQFLVLLAAGAVIMFFWSILGPSIFFFLLSLPVALFGIGAALGRYNGRAMFTYILPAAAFMSAPRIMVFKREPSIDVMPVTTVKSPAVELSEEERIALAEPAESRLKKLAYLLDSKNVEEADIIGSDKSGAIIDPVIKTQTRSSHGSVFSQIRSSFNKKAAPVDISANARGVRPAPKPSPSLNPVQAKPYQAPAHKKFDPNKII